MKLGGESGRGRGDTLEGTEWEVGLIQTYYMHVWVLNKICLKGGLTEECSTLNGTSISKAQGSTWKRGREGYKVLGSRVLLQDNAFQTREGHCTHKLRVAMTSYTRPTQD